MIKEKLFIYTEGATHFLRWEIPEWKKYFTLTDRPASDTLLLSFGPDALEKASSLPAINRYAVLFPGFGHNPLYNPEIGKLHRSLIKEKFKKVFINPGPLELAYKGLNNVYLYPFSIDTGFVKMKNPRTNINSLLHVSNDGAQKDWQRSERIMQLTNLKYEVYPPRSEKFLKKQTAINNTKNSLRRLIRKPIKPYLPYGYVDHQMVINKYQKYDGFVHVARDIKDKTLIDGKYTASLIEAGLTGAILFWHDTFGLGNNLETVFNLPLDVDKAASEIIRIRESLDVKKHSMRTHQEMMDKFNPSVSVRIRAEEILN